MKIRNGFVSNSSSSSFCIYGVSIDTDFDIDIFTDEAIELLKPTGLIENNDITDHYGVIDKISVPFIWSGEEDYVAIGHVPWSMKDNETKLEFQKRVEEEIKKYFKIEKLEWICETYNN